LKNLKDKKDITLSHSSANLLRGCEKKYVLYKVKGVDKDPDFDDNQEHFNIGKAVHFILEELLHIYDKDKFYELVETASSHFECPDRKYLIAAMAFKGLQIQKKEKLFAVICEYRIQTENTLGYVDLIACDEDKNWWIIDLKTSKKKSELTVAKLHNDYQLNLYSAHVKQIAKDNGLDPKKFMGCRYRIITKSTSMPKKDETIPQYIKRIHSKGWVKGFDVIIPKDDMQPEETLKGHKELWRRAKKLHEGAKPKKDYAYCSSFFRPCAYWSHCHGNTYTDSLFELDVREY